MPKSVQIGQFKAECLQLMADVNRTKTPLIVTKHHVPLVKIIPIDDKKKTFFECMHGTVEVLGDLLEPLDEKWDADSD